MNEGANGGFGIPLTELINTLARLLVDCKGKFVPTVTRDGTTCSGRGIYKHNIEHGSSACASSWGTYFGYICIRRTPDNDLGFDCQLHTFACASGTIKSPHVVV